MIKETVDAVRTAEIEADKIIATAMEKAQDMKTNIKVKGQDYKAEALSQAKEVAKSQMDQVVKECEEYDQGRNKEISEKVNALKEEAKSRENDAIKAVIEALV